MKINSRNLTLQEIYHFLNSIDKTFEPSLSSRLDLKNYAAKLANNAESIFIFENEIPVSGIFYYKNDSGVVYIPIIATIREYQGKGYFHSLLNQLFLNLKNTKFSSINLETWEGSRALNYYIKNGFKIDDRIFDRGGNYSIKLSKSINREINSFPFNETPLYLDRHLSSLSTNNVYIKRDDIFPILGGGSKGRKLYYILKKALDDKITTVVTCGSNESSHLRATVILCSQLGLNSISIIHDQPLQHPTHNLKLINHFSDEIIYCNLNEVKETMDKAINDSIQRNERPLYIYGGGHSVEGTYAYYSAMKRIYDSKQIKDLDIIVVASGTGTTQAGLQIGLSKYFPKAKLIGISIARTKERGINAINKAIEEFSIYHKESINEQCHDIILDDRFLFGGYGKITEDSNEILLNYSKKLGFGLDSTYSGKAFLGLLSYLDEVENKNILFWNTGSNLNFMENL